MNSKLILGAINQTKDFIIKRYKIFMLSAFVIILSLTYLGLHINGKSYMSRNSRLELQIKELDKRIDFYEKNGESIKKASFIEFPKDYVRYKIQNIKSLQILSIDFIGEQEGMEMLECKIAGNISEGKEFQDILIKLREMFDGQYFYVDNLSLIRFGSGFNINFILRIMFLK